MQQLDFFETKSRAEISIDRLQAFQPPEGYILAFSGGKDSIVLKDLAIRSGVKFNAVYNVTTVDPPELLRYINQYHHDVERSKPEINIWDLIYKNGGPPFRQQRYCCRVLKESPLKRGFVLTGVRWQESNQRSNRKYIETCYKNPSVHYLHPIIDWSEGDIWQYISSRHLPYCSLYDEGWKRIGCVLCPMSNQQRERERDGRKSRLSISKRSERPSRSALRRGKQSNTILLKSGSSSGYREKEILKIRPVNK